MDDHADGFRIGRWGARRWELPAGDRIWSEASGTDPIQPEPANGVATKAPSDEVPVVAVVGQFQGFDAASGRLALGIDVVEDYDALPA